MSSKNSLIAKISDYLKDRQKSNNFGTCRKCTKMVYWSTTKVASHIRSGHCRGATELEVQRFKQEFVYESPKHLIHRSCIGKTPKSTDGSSKSDEKPTSGLIRKIYVKQESSSGDSFNKRKKTNDQENDDSNEEQFRIIEQNNDTEEVMYELESAHTDDEKVEQIVFVTNESIHDSLNKNENVEQAATSKEEKFISVVYPQFEGRTKLQLIDEILDLQRRNELLQNKVKTYEDTINKLL